MLKKLTLFSLLFLTIINIVAFETQTTQPIPLPVPNAAQSINVNPFTVPVSDQYIITINAHAVNGGSRSNVVTIQTLNNNRIINEFNTPAIPRGARATLTHTFNVELAQGETISFKAKARREGVSLPIFNNEPSFKATIRTKEIKTKLP